VTDTCIPEDKAFRAIERQILELWKEADAAGERRFPHEYVYRLVKERLDPTDFQIDPADSWILAAAEKDLPIFVPGWEDSTLGNIFVAHVLNRRSLRHPRRAVRAWSTWPSWRTGTCARRPGRTSTRIPLPDAPQATDVHSERTMPASEAQTTIGFFQIGGGIAGDFPICVVPMIKYQDLGAR
jgi:deoxyhypusine synthase